MFNKYETKTYNRHQAMPSSHGKKKEHIHYHKWLCLCVLQIISGLVILQQTGYSDSNLLSPPE